MMASCQVTEWRATSQGRSSGGIRSAGSDRDVGATKARAVPKATTSTKMGAAAVGSVVAYQASASATAASHSAPSDGHPATVEPVGHRAR